MIAEPNRKKKNFFPDKDSADEKLWILFALPLPTCDYLERWDREGGRESQEGGDMGIYLYV